MQPFVIDQYRPHDEALVYHSWLLGFKSSPLFEKWAREDYEQVQRLTINRLLPRSKVLVARPPDWPEGIMGWMCCEQTPQAFVLHWSHVKPAYRTLGIPEALLEAMEPRGTKLFSHLRPPFTDQWKERGFAHAPNRAL